MKARLGRYVIAALVAMLALAMSSASVAQEHAEGAPHEFQDAKYWAKIFESPARAKWQKPDDIVKALDLKPGQTVVDIGAGTGYFTRSFAKVVGPSGEALGLDIEPGMIDYMKADAKKLGLKNYEARVVKPDEPGLASHSTDVVFFCDVLHHVDNRVAYLKKIAPALKPDGRVAVVDFKDTAPFGPPASMRITREHMIDEFSQAGYHLAREHDFLPYQYFLEFEPAPAN
jgi:ubiquinone/menaquinone biosynthesis C-methylase UbiE